jgi:hypothetical protein
MHNILRRIFTSVIMAGLLGCGGKSHTGTAIATVKGCGAVGCNSGVSVNIERIRSALPHAQRVILCLDRTCSQGNAGLDAVRTILRSVPSPTAGHEVLLAVQDRNGRGLKLNAIARRLEVG